jgi:hypothetical protein
VESKAQKPRATAWVLLECFRIPTANHSITSVSSRSRLN